jgi:hypothetical protein
VIRAHVRRHEEQSSGDCWSATVARNLFGGADPVGLTIQLGRTPVEVIGVMRRRGTDVGGADLDNTVVVPLQTAMRRLLNVPFIDALFLQARRISDLDALELDAIDVLRERLGSRSGVPVEFDVRNQSVLLRTQRGTSEAFRRLMIATAVFSLVAGAVTIMAVMMLSVRERVPEIALRRAVGARIRDVQWQFVIESALLAASGGILGVSGVGVALGAAAGVGGRDSVASHCRRTHVPCSHRTGGRRRACRARSATGPRCRPAPACLTSRSGLRTSVPLRSVAGRVSDQLGAPLERTSRSGR